MNLIIGWLRTWVGDLTYRLTEWFDRITDR